MGTSNIKFLFKGGDTMGNLSTFIQNPSLSNLVIMMKELINVIFSEIKKSISTVLGKSGSVGKAATAAENERDRNAKTANVVKKNDAEAKAIIAAGTDGEYTSTLDGTKHKSTDYQYGIAKKRIDGKEDISSIESLKNNVKLDEKKNKILNSKAVLQMGEAAIEYISGFVNSVLASTMARYKWPMQGAIAQSTGMALTPWHLTIGNPASPIISMNQIKVDSVEVRLGSEMLFNDLPKYIYAKITISQARNLGKQEILRFFGVNLKRKYSNVYKTTTIEQQLNMASIITDTTLNNRGVTGDSNTSKVITTTPDILKAPEPGSSVASSPSMKKFL